jgi:serine/threonine protein kinase
MEYVEGETLKNYVARGIGRLNWQQTLDVFLQVMDALRAVHHVGLLHRDIAPDNVYLCNDGRVKLLDFGEARYDMVDHAESFVAVKPGFAAEEQYRNNAKLGPWTDVYGLAACMYYCLTGQAPPNVTERSVQDCLRPPHEYGIVMPDDAERALLLALSIKACHRPQNVAAFQQLLMAAAKVMEIKNELLPKQHASVFDSSLSLGLSSNSISNHKPPVMSWGRWLMMAMVLFGLLVFLYRLASSMRPTVPLSEMSKSQVNEVSGSAKTDSDDSIINRTQQRNRERENAEALRLQQEAALKRFEEYRHQSSLITDRQLPQSDQHRIEHLQRLCEEWGATMDCPKDIWEK